jgi:hypothetical protein
VGEFWRTLLCILKKLVGRSQISLGAGDQNGLKTVNGSLIVHSLLATLFFDFDDDCYILPTRFPSFRLETVASAITLAEYRE